NRVRSTPEADVGEIKVKVGEAPLAGGHPFSPLLPRGGRPLRRGITAHDTIATRHTPSQTRRDFYQKLQDLYATFTPPLQLPSPRLACSPSSQEMKPGHSPPMSGVVPGLIAVRPRTMDVQTRCVPHAGGGSRPPARAYGGITHGPDSSV